MTSSCYFFTAGTLYCPYPEILLCKLPTRVVIIHLSIRANIYLSVLVRGHFELEQTFGVISIWRCCAISVVLPITEIRQSKNGLILTMRIPIHGKMLFLYWIGAQVLSHEMIPHLPKKYQEILNWHAPYNIDSNKNYTKFAMQKSISGCYPNRRSC